MSLVFFSGLCNCFSGSAKSANGKLVVWVGGLDPWDSLLKGIEKFEDSPRPSDPKAPNPRHQVANRQRQRRQVLKLTDQEILNLYHFAQSEVVTEKGWVGVKNPSIFGVHFLDSKIFGEQKHLGRFKLKQWTPNRNISAVDVGSFFEEKTDFTSMEEQDTVW